MNKKTLLIIIAVLVILGLGTFLYKACNSTPEPILAIQANVKALNTRDLEAFMATIDPQSAGFAQSRRSLKMLFNTYEVKCDLIESQIISQSPTDAKVSFVQVMRKVKGPDFKNNQVEGIYTLHRTQSGWQIFQTEVKSVKYLN